jgi:hypothetical protein
MAPNTAKSLLMQDRMDWNRPHLRWFPNRVYRLFHEVKQRYRL